MYISDEMFSSKVKMFFQLLQLPIYSFKEIYLFFIFLHTFMSHKLWTIKIYQSWFVYATDPFSLFKFVFFIEKLIKRHSHLLNVGFDAHESRANLVVLYFILD